MFPHHRHHPVSYTHLQGCHLLSHAGLVVVEPPCGALLDLTGELLLETADDGSDGSIIIDVYKRQVLCHAVYLYAADGLCSVVLHRTGEPVLLKAREYEKRRLPEGLFSGSPPFILSVYLRAFLV